MSQGLQEGMTLTEPRDPFDDATPDPYAYLRDNPAQPGSSSYLPAASTAPTETPSAPVPSGQPPQDDTIDGEGSLVGMTRRELREARARREAAQRALLAGSEPAGAGGSGASPATAEALSTPPTSTPTTSTPLTSAESTPSSGPASPSSPAIIGSLDPVDSPWEPVSHTEEPARKNLLASMPLGARVAAVLGALAFVAFLVWAVTTFTGNQADPAPTATAGPTATSTATSSAEEGGLPLQEMLPTSVQGGEFGEDGPSGMNYQLSAPGWVDNTNAAAEALESYVGIFTGGEEPVTLTASRFGSADAAAANAQAAATALGTPTDSGVVYPDENRGQYWIFNNDGLITIVWTDGDLGSYEIVSESAEAALDFYNGLSF